MNNIPKVTRLSENSCIWSHQLKNSEVTVYVPEPQKELLSESLNYGFIAPYLLVFTEEPLSYNQCVFFAKENGLERLASDFASSVVFVYPTTRNWSTASADILSEIVSNSRIHQYYENGYVKAWNRFTDEIDGYFIRGAIFRMCLFGSGKSADYIAMNCLHHFEGDGLWGRSDIAPVCCCLTSLNQMPENFDCDIPVISYGNKAAVNNVLKEKCKYFKERENPQIYIDFYDFIKPFRRMTGNLQMDPDLEREGLVCEPGVCVVKTSDDNNGDDKLKKEHKIGYFAFYNKNVFDDEPVPLVLGFHGGGDSCFFFGIMAGWEKIAHRHNFLLVTVENHLNSTATEMVEFVEILKKKYKIDSSRIYATGFSMGGIKTWDIIQEYPDLIAAAAPMDATVDVGENVYFKKINKTVNTTVSVPVFYAAGEESPLAEMPCQEQKCINRMKYILELNGVDTDYNVKLEEKEFWENKFWGINGDFEEQIFDKTRNSTLTLQKFRNKEGNILNVFGSISGQGHDCREHTCEQAWSFMSKFSRKN